MVAPESEGDKLIPSAIRRFLSGDSTSIYRGRVLVAALVVAYVPVPVAILSFAYLQARSGTLSRTVGAIGFAALVGSALLFVILFHLLRPIARISRIFRPFAREGTLPDLQFDDGTEAEQSIADASVADAQHTIRHMDRRLRQLTDVDDVTGLSNRKSGARAIAREIEKGSHFALCAMSLSNYDAILAGFGQDAIDTTCRQIAFRLITMLEPEAHIARATAKTFVFQIELVGKGEFLATRVEQIRLSVQNELGLPEFNIYPQLEAGVSIFRGQEVDAETLMSEAICAMSVADTQANGGTRMFSSGHRVAVRDACMIERDLRKAVDLKQLSLHFQPIVNLDQGRVVGAEALVRWTHPERGSIAPGVFIPIAEKSGLIDTLGLWILGETCRQLGAWSTTELRSMKISMNLSARQFLRPQTVQLILDAIDAHSIDARLLEVELTETTMVENRELTLKLLEEFRAAGVTTAIDDFGAGFTSLSYLKTLPFDRIKIDREFIRDVDQSSKANAICKSLIELGRGLEIEVLAEGTETAEEVERLRDLGCSLFQGYYFGRPVPAEQFADAIVAAETTMQMHRPAQLRMGRDMRAVPRVN